VRKSASDTWVFWVHASNVARFEQGYQQIASVGEIPGRDDSKTNVLQLVYQWLCNERNGRWLMVLDNADDNSIFFSDHISGERGALVKYLPQVAHGFILFTSRNRLAAQNLVGDWRHVIEIPPMDEAESLALLRKWIKPGQSTVEDETALVQALEYLPLAITQAGAYIANRSPRITVPRYLRLFHESESNQKYLLNREDVKDLRRDPSIRHAIIKTWQLSFEQIRQDQPAATDLLALMSMFDRQGIPEDLIHKDDDDLLQFEDALALLIGYSLIQTGIENNLFNMHRLVQLSIRAWLEIHHELRRWQEQSRAIMAQKFPIGRYENWSQCQMLLAHAKEVMRFIYSTHDQDRLNVAAISFACATYLYFQGSYGEAEAMYRQALEVQEKVLGPEHSSTLSSVHDLALVLLSQGKYKEGEIMLRQVLAIREKILGPEDPCIFHSVNNLGIVLSMQGKNKEAEIIHRQALEVQEKVLGPGHSSTLDSVHNLASALKSQGKYKEAEIMYLQVLAVRGMKLGYSHPVTLISAGSLAFVLSRQGKKGESEVLYRLVLEAQEKALGPKHPETLETLSNLASELNSQKKYEEAEAMHQQALVLRGKVLGAEHPNTLITMHKLGDILSSQGRYKEAEIMLKRALITQEKVLGYGYPDTSNTIKSLGDVLFRQGKYKEVEAIYQRALIAQEKVLGHGHTKTLTSLNQLAFVYQKQGRWKETVETVKQFMEILQWKTKVEYEGASRAITADHSLSHLPLHSFQNDYLVVPPPDIQVPSSPSTALYLVSNPLPADITILELNIISYDQALYEDLTEVSGGWFEISIIRPWCEESVLGIDDLKQSSGCRSHPEEFRELIQERGWYFQTIPIPTLPEKNCTGCITQKLFTHYLSPLWNRKTWAWSKNIHQDSAEPDVDFLSLLEEGDRLLVWARAQVIQHISFLWIEVF
jgi:tetratricopeptide (TPR) repeat protein